MPFPVWLSWVAWHPAHRRVARSIPVRARTQVSDLIPGLEATDQCFNSSHLTVFLFKHGAFKKFFLWGGSGLSPLSSEQPSPQLWPCAPRACFLTLSHLRHPCLFPVLRAIFLFRENWKKVEQNSPVLFVFCVISHTFNLFFTLFETHTK